MINVTKMLPRVYIVNISMQTKCVQHTICNCIKCRKTSHNATIA